MKNSDLMREVALLLQRNARMAEQEIADRLQTDAAAVRAAIADMEKERILLGYSALVDEEKLGLAKVRALIEVEVQPERDSGYDGIALTISKFPEVQTVYLVSGRYDLRVEVVGDSLQEVAFFVASKLASLQGVKGTATHFLLKKYKQSGFQSHQEEKYERLKIVP